MLPFCELFLGFSKPNPTVITGQSVSAGRPRSNKNAHISSNWLENLFAMSVESNSWLKTLCMTTTGVSTLKWSLLAILIFRNKTKLANHVRATHRDKDSFYCDAKFGEIPCIYYSATESNLRTHKK